jgi:SAM-dependent methyltransferase
MSFNPPLKDTSAIDAATPGALASGHRLFMSHMFADTDEGQVQYLLDRLDAPKYSHVVDMGCGVGEFARIASLLRPDLHWTLVNMSAVQLRQCPTGEQFRHLHADAHHTYLSAGCADAVIFTTALVQMDLRHALREAARLLRPGGTLFLSEMVRFAGDNTEWEPLLAGRVPYLVELCDAVREAGIKPDVIWAPAHTGDADDSKFREMLDSSGYLLDSVDPIIMRATRI